MRLDVLLESAGSPRDSSPFDTESGRAALAALEPSFAAGVDPSAQRRALQEAIGRAGPADLRKALQSLRDAFDAQVLADEVARVQAAFARSAEEGWRAWINALAVLISEFRLGAAAVLCGHGFPFTDPQKLSVARLGLAVSRMRQARWEDAYTEIDELATQSGVSGLARARLDTMLGQIQHHRFGDTTRARPLLEEAAKLAPSDGMVQSALGDLYLEEGANDEANAQYDRSVSLQPEVANGYVGRGDAALRVNSVEEAERWYRRATEAAAGDGLGYARLQSILGRRERIEHHAAELLETVERRVALDPDDAYHARLELGTSYLDVRDDAGAEKCFREAIALEPSWPRARLMLAELRRRQDRTDEAIALCRQVIDESPDFADAYIALSDIFTQAGRVDEALQVYERMPEPVRRSGAFLRKGAGFHNALGDLYYFAERLADAEREYRLAIGESPDEARYRRNLAYSLRKQGDLAGAEEAFRAAFGCDHDQQQLDNSLAGLANERGNEEYSQGRYREAIEHYRAAVGLRGDEPVFHSNLAGAWERLALGGEREHALQQAIESYESADAAGGRADFAAKIQRLRRRLEVARGWGSKALDRVWLCTPIAVEIASDLVALVEGTGQDALAEPMKQLVDAMRARVHEDYGVRLPGIRFRGNSGDLPSGSYVVMLQEVPLVMGTVHRDRVFITGAPEDLAALSSETPAVDEVAGREGLWLATTDVPAVAPDSVQIWQPGEYMTRHLEQVLHRNLSSFVGHQEVHDLVERHGLAPDPTMKLRPPDLTGLTTACRALLAEQVPIQPFVELYDCYKRETDAGTPLRDVVERIRGLPELRRRLPGNDRPRRVLTLGENLEAALRGALYSNHGTTVLALLPELCQEILAAVRNEVDARPAVLIVSDASLRPFLRRLTELEFPQLPVLSRAEFAGDLEAAGRAIIEIDAPGAPPDSFCTSRRTDPTLPEPEAAVADTPPDILVATSREFPDQASLGDEQPLEGLLGLMQDGLFYELGIVVPTVRRDDDDPRLAPREFRLRIDAVDHGTRTGLDPQEFLVNDTPERLRLLGISGEKAVNPASGADNSRVRETGRELEACRAAGFTTWGPAGYVVLALSGELRRTAARFHTDSITDVSLESLRAVYPALVERALARYTIATIAGVLRALLQEEIPVRDLRSILESLLEINGTTDADGARFILFTAYTDNLHPSAAAREPDRLGIGQLADYVRTTLKRPISHKYTRGRSTLLVLLLDPADEHRLGDLGVRPLEPGERERLLSAVESEWKCTRTSSPAILTTVEIRRVLRQLLRTRFPDLPVLAYQELSPELNVQPLARIPGAFPGDRPGPE